MEPTAHDENGACSLTAWFEEERVKALKEQFDASGPYTHVVLPELCNRDVLVQARSEIIDNVVAKYKETDLFKVYQTGDLANIDGLESELASKLPTLLQVRNAIYSSKFRNFIEQVTGLPEGTLIDKTDCSSNCYMHGGHLICHDDVISTRRVSYIIYLTDPHEEWRPEDGGALELYPVDSNSEPATEPTTFIPPAFNSMAVFTVQPGRSFHSIQQVYATDKPRLSISGWFHGLTPPPGAENASIAQLKASPADSTAAHGSDTGKSATPIAMVAGASAAEIDTVGGDTPCHAAAAEAPPQGNGVVGKKRAEPDGNHDDNDGIDRGMASAGKSFAGSAGGEAVARYDKGFVPLQHAVASAGAKLSAAEKRLLGEWINPLYLERGSMGSMVAQWEKASCVQLHKFLKPDVAAQILASLRIEDKRDGLGCSQVPEYTAGFVAPWSVQGPCHKQRFMCHPVPCASTAPPAGKDSAGGALARVARELFATQAFAKWLMGITEIAPKAMSAQVRRFRPGLDYTVATAGGMGEVVQLEADRKSVV